MHIQFATCERNRALEYIQRVYPSQNITDTPDCAGPLLDFVEKDIVRIQDPTMYGKNIGVVPGNSWNDSYRDAVLKAATLFHK